MIQETKHKQLHNTFQYSRHLFLRGALNGLHTSPPHKGIQALLLPSMDPNFAAQFPLLLLRSHKVPVPCEPGFGLSDVCLFLHTAISAHQPIQPFQQTSC